MSCSKTVKVSSVDPDCYQWDNDGTIEFVTAYAVTDEDGIFVNWVVLSGNPPADLTDPNALAVCSPVEVEITNPSIDDPDCYQWDNNGVVEQVTAYIKVDDQGDFLRWIVLSGNPPADLTQPDALSTCDTSPKYIYVGDVCYESDEIREETVSATNWRINPEDPAASFLAEFEFATETITATVSRAIGNSHAFGLGSGPTCASPFGDDGIFFTQTPPFAAADTWIITLDGSVQVLIVRSFDVNPNINETFSLQNSTSEDENGAGQASFYEIDNGLGDITGSAFDFQAECQSIQLEAAIRIPVPKPASVLYDGEECIYFDRELCEVLQDPVIVDCDPIETESLEREIRLPYSQQYVGLPVVQPPTISPRSVTVSVLTGSVQVTTPIGTGFVAPRRSTFTWEQGGIDGLDITQLTFAGLTAQTQFVLHGEQ